MLLLPFHQVDKALEQICAVLRARCALRVVLHGKQFVRQTGHALGGAIKQILVCENQARALQGAFIHRKGVVLAGDLDLAGGQLAHGMVAAAVAEFHLKGARPARQRNHLMPQADAEDG